MKTTDNSQMYKKTIESNNKYQQQRKHRKVLKKH